MRNWIIFAVGIILLLLCLFIAGSCNPLTTAVDAPAGTMLYDRDGDGVADALVADVDADGQPDLSATGEPMILVDLRAVNLVDSIIPNTLASIGAMFGLPIVIGIAGIWKRNKWAKQFANVIASVQLARLKLKDSQYSEVLQQFDLALGHQTKETRKTVEKIKAKLELVSVTD